MAHDILYSILLLLTLSIVVVWVLRLLHLPPILGYLLVGVTVGPHAFGWITPHPVLDLLAEIGVTFLLFTIGLEFSLRRFVSMRGAVLGLGGAQVVGSTLAGAVLLWWLFDMSPAAAVVAGGALALSSTAIVSKQLGEQFELQSRHGRNAMGILLFQDLAVVPFLVAIPILGSDGGSMAEPLMWALLKGAAAFGLMLAVGHWLFGPFLHQMARSRSTELFTLAALAVALAAALATQLFGLSLALGAFLAGMMLGESEYRHQVEVGIAPFRDVLMAVFFISVGMQLNLFSLPDIWSEVLLLTIGLVLGKLVYIALVAKLSGSSTGVAMRTGIVLSQGGEFGFALLALAVTNGLMGLEDTQPVVAAILISMLLAPILIRYNGSLVKSLSGSYLRQRQNLVAEISEAAKSMNQSVILCRYGWTGQHLTRFLEREGIPVIALDLNPQRVREARDAGEPVFYADYTHTDVLAAAGLQQAAALVITTDDADVAQRIIRAARHLRQDVPIIVRTRNNAEAEQLKTLGATDIVPENIEGSMTLATHVLHRLGFPADDVLLLIEQARARRSSGLNRVQPDETGSSDLHSDIPIHLRPVTLAAGDDAVGQRLGQLGLSAHDVHVDAVERAGVRGYQPSDELVLRAGDTLILAGETDALDTVTAKLHPNTITESE